MNCVGPNAPAQEPRRCCSRHVAARDDLQRGEQFVAEIVLAAADAGKRRSRTDHRAVADRRAVVGFDAPDRCDDVTVDAVGSLHRVERRAMLGQDRAAVGDARVGDEDIEIFPRRLGELGLRVEEIHDPQVGRDARQQLIEHLARHVAALRQRPDRFEAGAEIRRRGADGGRLHQRMAGSAVFAGPFARRLARRRCPGSARGVCAAGFPGDENSERRSKFCAAAGPAPATSAKAAAASSQPYCRDRLMLIIGALSPARPCNHCSSSHVIWLRSHQATIHRPIHAPLISSGVEPAA